MKKLFVVMMVVALVALVGGCVAFNSFLCSPSESQTQAAAVGETLAQAALQAAAVYTGNPIVLALSTQAVPVFQKVVAGYCATNTEWQAAVTALEQAQQQPPVAKAMKAAAPKEDAINYLRGVQ